MSDQEQTAEEEAPEEAAETDEAVESEAAAEAEAPDGSEDAPEDETADSAGVLKSAVEKWIEALSSDWADSLGREASIELGEVETVDADELAERCKDFAVAAAGKLTGESDGQVAFVIGSEAAVSLAGAILDKEGIENVDDDVRSAVGGLAGQAWTGLEGAWKELGAENVEIEAGEAADCEGAPDGFEDDVLFCGVSIKVSGAEAAAAFLVPLSLAALFAEKETDGPGGLGALKSVKNIERILDIKVRLVVQIARRNARLAEVLAFRPGTVVEFDKRNDDLLDLMAGHAPIGKGEAVKVGESFGIRVVEIGGVRERVRTLGM